MKIYSENLVEVLAQKKTKKKIRCQGYADVKHKNCY